MSPSFRSSRHAQDRIRSMESNMTNDNTSPNKAVKRSLTSYHPAGRSFVVDLFVNSFRTVHHQSPPAAAAAPEYIRKRRLRRRALDAATTDSHEAKNIFRSHHQEADNPVSLPVQGQQSEATGTVRLANIFRSRHEADSALPTQELQSDETGIVTFVNLTADAPPPSNTNQSHKPTPVAIVFGFLLVAVLAAGLCFYIYIFCRKRKKHLLKKKRMMAAVTAAPMPGASIKQRPPPRIAPSRTTAVTADRTSGQKSDDSSDGSSAYEGLDSGSEGDVFAKELKLAATLDRQAWENFIQRKTQYELQKLDEENVTDQQIHIPSTQTDGVRLYGGEETEGVEALHADSDQMFSASPWLGLELVNSFPYGDEIPNTLSNLSPEDLAIRDADPNDFLQQGASLDWARKSTPNDANSGSPSKQRGGRAAKANDADSLSEEDLFFSLAPSQSQETATRNLAEPEGNGVGNTADTSMVVESRNEIEDERIDPDTEDMIKEVQRLSLFVKKYEKKKEKRIRRVMEYQQQAQSESSFDPDQNGVDNNAGEKSNAPPSAVGKLSHLPKIDTAGGNEVKAVYPPALLREAANVRSGLRSMTFSKSPAQDGSDGSGGEGLGPKGLRRGLEVGGMFLTDASSDSGTDDDEDFFRLGITPFSVQKPGGPSPQHGAMVVEAALQSMNKGILMTDSSERSNGNEDFFRSPVKITRGQDPTTNDENVWGIASPERRTTRKQSLHALRFSESIIDNTNSEVPSSVLTPSTAAQLLAATEPTVAIKAPNSGGKNSKFANIVSMFEAKPKEAIFPPNESWQFNS